MRTVSNAQASLYQRCEQAWYYNYVDELIPKSTATFLKRGSLFHELMEVVDNLMKQGVKPGDPILFDYVLDFAEGDLEVPFLEYSTAETYNRVLKTVERFIKEFSPEADMGIQILGVEDEFLIPLETVKGRKFMFNGIMDRTYLDRYGKLVVLDRKTTVTGRHWTEDQLMMDQQSLLYAAALRTNGNTPDSIAIDSVSTYPYKNFYAKPYVDLFKRVRAIRSGTEMDYSLLNLGRIVDRMVDIIDGDTPIRTLSKDCTKCRYHDLCFYAIRGIDNTPVIMRDFKKKDGKLIKPETGLEGDFDP